MVLLVGICGSALIVGEFTPASAQVVEGRLVDLETGTGGVSGAMITLMDRDGNELFRNLTRQSGFFALSAPSSGEYRLRADRIGYATTYSDYFRIAVGDTLTIQIAAPVAAIVLEGITAEGDRRCRVRPEEGLAVSRVWEEVRKALATAAWTQERGVYRYEMMQIDRQLDRDGNRVISENRDFSRGFFKTPYVAKPAEELIEFGFASLSPDESIYWAPDANVLLSDPFLDTHCFQLHRDEEQAPGLVGLAFEPVPGRRVAEIAGTIWIDPTTSQLRWLDFSYRNLALPDRLYPNAWGGKVEFEGLPNGTWIVKSWRLRLPRPGVASGFPNGSRFTVLDGVSVKGGDVIRVHGAQGTVHEAESMVQIVGIVFDTLQTGLPGATVMVEGTGIQAITDAEGRFQLADLDPGLYSVNFSHSYMDDYAFRPEPFEIEVLEEMRNPAQVNFASPTVGRILRRLCRGQEPPERVSSIAGLQQKNRGILVGQVTDEAGQPVSGLTLQILSRGYDLLDESNANAFGVKQGVIGMEVTTDATGRYRLCWLPVDMRLEVILGEPGESSRDGRDGIQSRSDVSSVLDGKDISVTVPGNPGHERLDLQVTAIQGKLELLKRESRPATTIKRPLE